MKWLIIAPDMQDKYLKAIEDFFENNHKCEISEVYADLNKTKTESELLDDLHEVYNATHCIILDADLMVHEPDCIFALGVMCGKNVKTFIHGSSELLERRCVKEPKFGTYISMYSSVEEILKTIHENFTALEEEDERRNCIESLISRGIPFSADSYALYMEKKKEEICDKIIRAGIDVNAFTSEGVPLLCIATRNDNVEQLKILLDKGADINAVSKDRGYSAVMDAVWRKDYEIAKILIEKGADLNIMSSDGQPILVLAVGNGNAKIVKLLIESGADPDIQDSMGMSARAYAKLFKKDELVELIESVPVKE